LRTFYLQIVTALGFSARNSPFSFKWHLFFSISARFSEGVLLEKRHLGEQAAERW